MTMPGQPQESLHITDASGAALTLHPPYTTAISLVPSITETVFGIGAGSALVGRTRYCVHPAPDVREVENIGGTKDPKLGRIIELAPGIVLANREENREQDIKTLRDAGVVVHVGEPKTPDEALEAVALYGVLFDKIEESARIVLKGELALDMLSRERTEREHLDAMRLKPRGKPRVACYIWREPWMAVGRATYIGAMIETLGGEHIFKDAPERYFTCPPEELARHKPDIVLLPSEPFHFKPEHVEELRGLAPQMPASINKGIKLCDGEDLSWFGARTPDALMRLAPLVNW